MGREGPNMTQLRVTVPGPPERAPEDGPPAPQLARNVEQHIIEPPEPTLFELRCLSVWYGHKPALAGITLKVPVNRVTALIGPSGCGKSTLLRCLNRMNDLIPGARTSGRVEYHGFNIYSP